MGCVCICQKCLLCLDRDLGLLSAEKVERDVAVFWRCEWLQLSICMHPNGWCVCCMLVKFLERCMLHRGGNFLPMCMYE
jgi:hypothetical protein